DSDRDRPYGPGRRLPHGVVHAPRGGSGRHRRRARAASATTASASPSRTAARSRATTTTSDSRSTTARAGASSRAAAKSRARVRGSRRRTVPRVVAVASRMPLRATRTGRTPSRAKPCIVAMIACGRPSTDRCQTAESARSQAFRAWSRYLAEPVRRIPFVLVLCLAGVAGAAAATAASNPVPTVGVADDAPKYADDGGEAIYQRLRGLGMRETRMVVDFDPAEPKTIQEKAFLDRSVDKAVAAGIEVVFSVYPHVPRTFATDTAARIAAFGSYLALLARTYPQVKRFIVLNEPNEGYFFAPQFSARKNVSAAIAEKVLATAYDRLKRVDPSVTVIGLGLSPDGNGVTSTAPVRFIQALGAAYRASHRRRPIMDELAYHIHPRDSRTFDGRTHFRWPN